MLASKPTAENKILPPGTIQLSSRFSEVVYSTSKNYDVRQAGIVQPEDIGIQSTLSSGETVAISSMFDIGSEGDPRVLAVVSMHDPRSDTYRATIGGLVADESGKITLTNAWVPLNKDTSVIIGRHGDHGDGSVIGSEQLWPGTGYFSSEVSRRHVSLSFDGQNVNVLDTSTGGTRFYKSGDTVSESPTDDLGYTSEHTVGAKKLAEIIGMIKKDEGNEEFSGRPIIDRDTADPQGMVDIRSWAGGGEAIVVDSEKDPEPYKELLDKCLNLLEHKGVFAEKDLVQAIYDTVHEAMIYDLDFANRTSDSIDTKSRKINLAVYLDEGKGVCRHMALASQWLGARLTEKYPAILEGGKFTSPVNQNKADNTAHEWVRYTNAKGKVFIIDVAQEFCGTLEDVTKDAKRGVSRWEYFANSEEKRDYETVVVAEIAVRGTLVDRFKRRK